MLPLVSQAAPAPVQHISSYMYNEYMLHMIASI